MLIIIGLAERALRGINTRRCNNHQCKAITRGMIILNAISFIIDARGSRHAKQTNWLILAAIQNGIAQAGTMKPITRKGHRERARWQNQGAIKFKVQFNLKSKVMERNVTHS